MSEDNIQRSLGQIEGALNSLTEAVHRALAENKELDKRVSSLENSRTSLVAFTSGVSAVVTLVSSLVWKLFHSSN